MSKTTTPLESFTHLTDNIPSWLTRLDDLTAQVAEQNARFIRMSQFGEQLKKQKHGSTESLRPPKNEDKPGDDPGGSKDKYNPPAPSYTCLSHASRTKVAANNALVSSEIQRKRKPTSKHTNSSGHARYRTKSMVVVYYDSAIQEAFEGLVRSIAGARNTLRKGKDTASFKARMASLGMDDDPFSNATDYKSMKSKMMPPSMLRSRLGPNPLGGDKSSCFEQADRDLETAQSLCEVAAHQFLRDGDCRLEIQGTRGKFEHCLEVAKKEKERLQEEAEREKTKQAEVEMQPETPQDTSQPIEVDVSPPAPDPIPLVSPEYTNEKIAPQIEHPPLKQINLVATGAIEVDDVSDNESVHIDLSAIRRTRRV